MLLLLQIHQQQTQQQAHQQSHLQQQSQRQIQQQQQGQSQQEPTAAEINLVLSSLGLGLPSADSLQLANWDLKKLAMYLVSKKPFDYDDISHFMQHRKNVQI